MVLPRSGGPRWGTFLIVIVLLALLVLASQGQFPGLVVPE